MEIKTGIKKGIEEDSLQPYFSIGNQTFHLQEIAEGNKEDTKEVAEWMVKMLEKAFVKLDKGEIRYIGQYYLPIAKTIGDLKKQIKNLPDEMIFGFLNQPVQQIAIRHYSDDSKQAMYNGTAPEADYIYAWNERIC